MTWLRGAGERVRQICDRFWLFTIAALALAIIGMVLGSIVLGGKMPEGAGELFASAITGLLLVVQKVIEAQQQRRMADHLAQSSPGVEQASGKPDDPVHTVEEGK